MHNESLRLFGINAPEMRGDEKAAGTVSRDRLREWIDKKEVVIRTIADKKGKYGRYLAEIWAQDAAGVWFNVNSKLGEEGVAEEREY